MVSSKADIAVVFVRAQNALSANRERPPCGPLMTSDELNASVSPSFALFYPFAPHLLESVPFEC